MEQLKPRTPDQLIHIFEKINSKFPKHLARQVALITATLLGSGCNDFIGNPLNSQPPRQPESVLVTPSSQPNPTQFESPLEYIASTSTAQPPQSEATDVVTPESEPTSRVLFSGHPSEGASFGDNGIKTDCNWGAEPCDRNGRLLWGAFLKDSSIPEFKDNGFEGINNSRLRFTVDGQGFAKIQVVDSKNGEVFFDKNMELPASISINNKGVVPDGEGSFTGYGTELVVRPPIDHPEQAIITGVSYEVLGAVDPEVAQNPDPKIESFE